ncbi:MAG TPA: hypothetical protein VKQ09_03845 [Sphingomonas sp.]|nr:hypothetical protein [Sphingomonas sp.]
MRRFLIPALLAASVAVPAVAASPVHSFSREGDSYQYTADRAADGSIVLNGRVQNTGEAFKLRVADRAVSGRVGRNEVSFSVSPKLMAELQNEVPANGEALASN